MADGSFGGLLNPNGIAANPSMLAALLGGQGGGSGGIMPQQAQNAPAPVQQAPMPQQAAMPPLPTQTPVNPVLGGLDNLLFHGAFQGARNSNYQQQVNAAVMQRAYANAARYASQLPAADQALFWQDPKGFTDVQENNRKQVR